MYFCIYLFIMALVVFFFFFKHDHAYWLLLEEHVKNTPPCVSPLSNMRVWNTCPPLLRNQVFFARFSLLNFARSEHSLTCFAYCQKFRLSHYYFPTPFNFIFPESSSTLTCVGWLTGSCLRQYPAWVHKLGHPARRHRSLMLTLVLA